MSGTLWIEVTRLAETLKTINKLLTNEIAMYDKAHTNRKCINGYSLRGFRKLNSIRWIVRLKERVLIRRF